MKKYIYPHLPASGITTSLIRFGGYGLANCLFVYARGIMRAKKENLKIISPTWLNFSIGTYIRKEADKRHYFKIFKSGEEISNPLKSYLLCFKKREIVIEEGLGNYFEDLIEGVETISDYLINHVCNRYLDSIVNFPFDGCAAVHVRLGDYIAKYRTPISWYCEQVSFIHNKYGYKFLLFSDGADSELEDLMKLDYVERVSFGSALSDIIAISKCQYLVGSDSTFSGWGAFLGQVPCVFYRKHFGRVLRNSENEIVESEENLWR